MSTLHPTYRAPSRTAAGNLTLTHFIDVPSNSSTSSPISSSLTPLSTLAQTIHRSVSIPRTDGEHVRRVVALSEELYPRSTANGRLQWWFPYVPGEGFDEDAGRGKQHVGVTVAINNLSNVDFPAIHFAETKEGDEAGNGVPIRSRFYTFDSWAHYLRIWKGNPLPVYEDEAPSASSTGSPSTATFPASLLPSSSVMADKSTRRIVAWRGEQRSLRVFFRVQTGRKEVVEDIVKRDMESIRLGRGLGVDVTGDNARRGWFSWKENAKL